MLEHDVLVIGAGLAGMRAAIAARSGGADTAIISKVHPVRSHSNAAQGGINAALATPNANDQEHWNEAALEEQIEEDEVQRLLIEDLSQPHADIGFCRKACIEAFIIHIAQTLIQQVAR